ncbi:hypothetical protein Aduo_018448 [Ancylostoma duodenale]
MPKKALTTGRDQHGQRGKVDVLLEAIGQTLVERTKNSWSVYRTKRWRQTAERRWAKPSDAGDEPFHVIATSPP